MPLDREKLLKVLRLTASDQDGEALAALRMAQRLMTSGGVTWEGLITGSTASPRMSEYDRQRSRETAARAWADAYREERRRKAEAQAAQDRRRGAQGDPRNNFDLRAAGIEILAGDDARLLTAWERGFLDDWRGRPSSRMSVKQREIFIRIIDSIEARKDARAKGYG